MKKTFALGVALALVWACGGGGSTNGDAGPDASSDAPSGSDSPAESGPAPIAGLRAFFTDLISGPNTGGQNGKGAFVTIWGNGFGAAQGSSTITVGGGAVDNYPVWTSTKITFQLGAAAASGDVVVHVSGKGDSNALPFTVRAGNIFFVTTSGDDGHDGSYATPWKTIVHAKKNLQPGDIAYLGDGVSQTTQENYNAALSMDANDASNSGTASMPKALVAYPGAKVTVGAESGLERGILTPGITGTFDYWVISQLVLRGETEAIDLEGGAVGWRVVGNDISCPNGAGQSGCVTGCDGDCTAGLKLFGNVVHDAAANVTSITKYYHGIYFGSDHVELGWNEVRDGKTCRAIQFHDSQGPNDFDLSVHDNLIHGTVCDGLNFASVDPSKGPVLAWNNVIYDVGHGPDPSDGSSDYAGIYVANITNQGSPGSGNVQIFDNTIYDSGSRGGSASGAIARAAGPVGIQMDDNVIVAVGSENYFSGDTSAIAGTNNLLFGGAGSASFLGGTLAQDPMFVAPASHDFHLKPGSPAVDHGATTSASTDFDGNARPQGAAFDVGAYELVP